MKQPAWLTGNPGQQSLGKELIGRVGRRRRLTQCAHTYMHACTTAAVHTTHEYIQASCAHTDTMHVYHTYIHMYTYIYYSICLYHRVYTNHTYTDITHMHHKYTYTHIHIL